MNDDAKDSRIRTLEAKVEDLQARLRALEEHFQLQYLGPPRGYFKDHRGQ